MKPGAFGARYVSQLTSTCTAPSPPRYGMSCHGEIFLALCVKFTRYSSVAGFPDALPVSFVGSKSPVVIFLCVLVLVFWRGMEPAEEGRGLATVGLPAVLLWFVCVRGCVAGDGHDTR